MWRCRVPGRPGFWLQVFHARERSTAFGVRRWFASCGRCGASPLRGPDFYWCDHCGRVPPAASAKSVTYFEALGLPARFEVDLAAAKPRFRELDRRFEDLARKGEDMEALKAYVQRCQEAWKTLRDPLMRAEHLLAVHGVEALPHRGSELLPSVQALEDEALSAEVEDSAAIARAVEQNSRATQEAESRLAAELRGEHWVEARSALLEVQQRRALKTRLEDLAMENSEAATPAHSSTVGGIH
uniref:Co-chaperone HscB C-terminal oligomerisation domain-containing protein n=1 Tax=Alexandrium monilatum TaxID=311494 RepID=A0A7S4UMA0_9DINO|mmetsp:Transcript_101525/g.302876  ORF Transcript_101525/g.302876 Transcript_101525/m.302876 type:complete len:242 (+) Transcript_101525:47-772(+)